ncbi:MAG TPA: dihydropteroate synthase [Polyangiales bacterium]|jgi:dihydropteroate synthase|nr:dihydropteroate synthase [Polyangiales bacterium]
MRRRCEIWAVVNVTPDSFSDGGQYLEHGAAIARGAALLSLGADVLDIGGASSRPAGKTYGPGASDVSVEEELRRVLPVIEGVVAQHGARVSIDTTRAEVAEAALHAGARIVNDVSNGSSQALLEAVARADAELVLMHNRGDGSVSGSNIVYTDVVTSVIAELLAAAERAQRAGVRFENIWLDPGVGFAKTAADSLAVIAGLPKLLETGHRVLLGPSRKSFISAVEAQAGVTPPSSASERLGGTAAAVAMGVAFGVHAVRVHDLPEMRQTVLVTEALIAARAGRGLPG